MCQGLACRSRGEDAFTTSMKSSSSVVDARLQNTVHLTDSDADQGSSEKGPHRPWGAAGRARQSETKPMQLKLACLWCLAGAAGRGGPETQASASSENERAAAVDSSFAAAAGAPAASDGGRMGTPELVLKPCCFHHGVARGDDARQQITVPERRTRAAVAGGMARHRPRR
ncbi:hypothetical protein P154DRAFT_573898 [Amniculicola lignicola CBS 123094]|uniref:Uncharacterized protein n=1 Tax=Amniculicola lignicola CBS 123094 TaxID=1392246 RepID=A0A6A5WL73_9PLEO|nr:hypothetical protein P154DRAFT_573898 [Amniculicola lignicola CBS 123094]